jgi:Plasmid encoded RepA protein
MSDEDRGIGCLYSGWCQAALPHRRLPDDQGWQIDGERVCLIVEPGMRRAPSGKPEPVGVPYGSRARLILLRLQSEALRTGSREVELGKSLRDWLSRMGIPVGGASFKAVRDQTERISRCRLTFEVRHGGKVGLTNQSIMESAIFLETDEPRQGKLFAQTATLTEAFFQQLKRHPVPLEESAIRAIANNSMALDVYAWLAYRLHVLVKSTPVSWHSLKKQFGCGFARMDNFRVSFQGSLRLALAVYRDARVSVEDAGLVLHPSRPPVPAKQIVIRAS